MSSGKRKSGAEDWGAEATHLRPKENPFSLSFSTQKKGHVGEAKEEGRESRNGVVDPATGAKCLAKVRALNSQFARWVREQEEAKIDHLWTEGVGDYIHHANSILEEFSDVVEWLKAKAASSPEPQPSSSPSPLLPSSPFLPQSTKSSGLPHLLSSPPTSTSPFPFISASAATTLSAPRGGVSGTSFNSSLPASSSFALSSPSAAFAPSWAAPAAPASAPGPAPGPSSGAAPGPAPVPGPTSADVERDEGEVEDEETPDSPSVRRVAEDGVRIGFESKAKMYMQKDKTEEGGRWRDRGSGMVVVKIFDLSSSGQAEGTSSQKASLMFRNEVGKVLLNASLYANMRLVLNKAMLSTILMSVQDDTAPPGEAIKPTPRLFMFKLPSPEVAGELHSSILSHCPKGTA